MAYKIDMDGENYDDGEIERLVPEGWYDLQVKGIKLKSKKNDPESQYFILIFKIMNGPSKGVKLACRTSAMKGKRWLLKQFMDSLDIVPEDSKYILEMSMVKDKLVQGQVRNSFSSFLGGDESQIIRFKKPEVFSGP